MRLSTALCALLVTAAPATAVVLPAYADTADAPLIAPVADAQLSGETTLVADITGYRVAKFVVKTKTGSRSTTQMVADEADNDPMDGIARWKVPTYGLGPGTQIGVVHCATSGPSECTAQPTIWTSVDVANPVTWDAPTEPRFVDLAAAEKLAVTVTDDAPGNLNVWWNHHSVAVTRGIPTTVAMFDVATSVTDTVRVNRCAAGGPFMGWCSDENTSAPVTARRGLTLTVGTPSPAIISPDSDGNHDSAQVDVQTEGLPGQTTTWTLTDGGFQPIVDPQPIAFSGGSGSFVVDPAALGLDLTSRTYAVRVTTTAEVEGHTFTTVRGVSLDVDLIPTTVASLSPNLRTFHPWYDGYQDSVTLTADIEGEGGPAQIEVLDSAGKTVSAWPSYLTPTDNTFVWGGRSYDTDKFLPAGTYRFRITMTDEVGNVGTFTGGTVTLTAKRLHAKTWTRTISARGSLAANWSGNCSSLRKPGLRGMTGSVGYYSKSKCSGRTTASRVAAGLHLLRLPTATTYNTVSIKAYGAAVKPKLGHRAGLFLLRPNGDAVTTRALSPGLGWHAGGSTKATRIMDDAHWIGWMVSTAYGQRYDVKSFTVTLSYAVLS